MAKSKQAALIGEVGETFVANYLKKKVMESSREIGGSKMVRLI